MVLSPLGGAERKVLRGWRLSLRLFPTPTCWNRDRGLGYLLERSRVTTQIHIASTSSCGDLGLADEVSPPS